MRISSNTDTLTSIASKYGIILKNTNSLKSFKRGLELLEFAINSELEHGTRFKKIYGVDINITNDDIDITMKIVLAHLIEDPWYYERLEKMEHEAEKMWSVQPIPQVLKDVLVVPDRESEDTDVLSI
jgi:hypothetical protein